MGNTMGNIEKQGFDFVEVLVLLALTFAFVCITVIEVFVALGVVWVQPITLCRRAESFSFYDLTLL